MAFDKFPIILLICCQIVPMVIGGACDPGTYGTNCKEQCGHCRFDEICDSVTGTCASCSLGYKQPECKEACDPGTFGNCSIPCGHCYNDEPCLATTGMCLGCSAGYTGVRCMIKCARGTYGLNCGSKCGPCKDNGTCHHITGACENVQEPSRPGTTSKPECQTDEKEGSKAQAIVVVLIIVLVCVIIVFIVTVIFLLRKVRDRAGTQKTSTKKTEERPLDDIHVDRKLL